MTTQAEILSLLRSLQESRALGVILITHDLRVAFSICDRIYVLYAGSVLEVGEAPALEHEPCIPTRWACCCRSLRRTARGELTAIAGAVPKAHEVAGPVRVLDPLPLGHAPCAAPAGASAGKGPGG